MNATSETVVGVLIDSALLRADLEALLDAVRRAEVGAEPAGADGVRLERWRWERVLERADLCTQSYVLAKARAAQAQEQGPGGGR
jgi:hypothetical protein